MESKQEFNVGDIVVAYAHESRAKEMGYRSAYFHGTIEKINNGVATVIMKDGHTEYKNLFCLRLEKEVMEHLRDLWVQLENVCIDDDDCIDSDFHIWEKGTDRQEIWHWFEEQCPNGIKDLIGIIEDYVDAKCSWDFVRCNNCMTRMIVPTGVGKCPHCGKEGCLTDLHEPDNWCDVKTDFKVLPLPEGYDPLED